MRKRPGNKAGKKEHEKALMRLFHAELQQILWVEKRLSRVLSKLLAKAKDEELRTLIEDHLVETDLQKPKVEEVFKIIGRRKLSLKCQGMSGILKETETLIKEMPGDASILVSLRKIEHYEIAAYGTLQTMAMQFDMGGIVRILGQILGEEKEMDEKLGKLTGRIFKK